VTTTKCSLQSLHLQCESKQMKLYTVITLYKINTDRVRNSKREEHLGLDSGILFSFIYKKSFYTQTILIHIPLIMSSCWLVETEFITLSSVESNIVFPPSSRGYTHIRSDSNYLSPSFLPSISDEYTQGGSTVLKLHRLRNSRSRALTKLVRNELGCW